MLGRTINGSGVFDIRELTVAITVSHPIQLSGRHFKHFRAGPEIFLWDRKRNPELIAAPLIIDLRASNKARFDFLFRVQEADVGDVCLIVDREGLAFSAVIDGDLLAVDGFDKAEKDFTFSFLSGEFIRSEGQEEGDDKE